jgi:hypothetical protein
MMGMGVKMSDKKEKQKSFYDIRVEVNMPGVVTYRVMAESPESAIQQLKEHRNYYPPTSVKYDLLRKRSIKVTVYDAGCSVIKYAESTDKV